MGTRGFLHTVEQVNTDGVKTIGSFVADPSSYNLAGQDNELIAEEQLSHYYKSTALPPGEYRITVTNMYEGNTVLVINRALPLPEEWTRLSTWHSEATGRPSKFHAVKLLHEYPGTDLRIMGQHLEAFAAHYRGDITLAELTEQTGYELPDGTPEPSSPYKR